MKILLLFSGLLFFNSIKAQQDNFIKTSLTRLENSRKYLLAVAEVMPEDKYGYSPTPEEMNFAKQLMHIAAGLDWHAQTLIMGRKKREEDDSTYMTGGRSKKEMIDIVNKTFLDAITSLKKVKPTTLDLEQDFAGKKRTKRQSFFLLLDHITHHRAQMIVYLRLNGISPPEYTKFQ